MIRDPSDGSIKEKVDVGIPTSETSGLPITKDKPDEVVRLEKSREWLKTYWAKRSLAKLIPDEDVYPVLTQGD